MDANFFAWLAQGPFLLFASIIGAIVSIDVFVVEATRDYPPECGNRKWWHPTARMKMAMTHAFLHSFSFLIYIWAIYGLEYLPLFIIEIFDLPSEVYKSVLVLFNFLIIVFVWWTYRSKVKEDHSKKDDEDAAPDRYDMKLFIEVLRMISKKLRLPTDVTGLVIAATVAVDMLAISALLKVWLLPSKGSPPIASMTGCVLLDTTIFASIILLVVLLSVFFAHGLNQWVRNKNLALVALRLLEPLAVFYILAGALREWGKVFESDVVLQYSSGAKFALDITLSISLTASLLIANRLSVEGLRELANKRSNHRPISQPAKSFSDLYVELGRKLPILGWSVFIFLLILGALWYSFSTGQSHNHLIEATGWFSIAITLATVIVLYFPSRYLDRKERTKSASVFSELTRMIPADFWARWYGSVCALAALNAFLILTYGRGLVTETLILWSAHLLLAWFLFNLRRYRFYRAMSSPRNGAVGRVADADAGEFISVLGISSALVAVFAQVKESIPF